MVDRNLLAQTISMSIQEQPRDPYGGLGKLIYHILQANELIPPWWSTQRDQNLRMFWRAGDHISGAMYAMESKMTTIPFHVEPLDMSVKKHVHQAQRIERQLMEGAEFGAGWSIFYGKILQDLLGQDNGRFAEVIGPGRKDGPIVGAPLTVAALDAAHCQRTGDPEFPIIYTKQNGDRHKLHYTRVMFDSQMPSNQIDMLEVGFCAVSRAIHNAQQLIDISTYKQEKLGSRPLRGLMLVGGGLGPEEVGLALDQTQHMSDARGLARFSLLPIVGSRDLPEPTIDLVPLSSLPDGFSDEEFVSLAMAGIALGFGVDARELWPQSTAGATRADALLSHIKSRGKGPGHILQTTKRLFDSKFLPPHLRMVFDYQDDAEDRMVAEIRDTRSQERVRNIEMDITTVRIERQRMLEDGDIDRAQYQEMELEDGRLIDGKSALTLLYSPDKAIRALVTLEGVSNPLRVHENDPEVVFKAIDKKREDIYQILAASSSANTEKSAFEALACMVALEELYAPALEQVEMEEQAIKDEEATMRQEENRARIRGDERRRNQGEGREITSPSRSEEDGAVEDIGRSAHDDRKG